MNKFFILFILLLLSLNPVFAQSYIIDSFADEAFKNQNFKEIKTNLNYNYQDFDRVIIKLTPLEKVSTKKNLNDGDFVSFKVKDDVIYDRKVILKKNSLIKARIKTYMTRGWNGIPGQIIIDDFDIYGLDTRKLQTPYIKKGLNLTLMIMPIKWVLTPIPFVGSLANLIVGGHAQLSPRSTVILYYYPNWEV